MVQRFVPVGLPEVAEGPVWVPGSDAGLLLQVQGAPSPRRINGIGAGVSPTGKPFVRVELGRLVVLAHDLVSIRTAAAAWAEVEQVARRMWPDPSDVATRASRARITSSRRGGKRDVRAD